MRHAQQPLPDSSFSARSRLLWLDMNHDGSCDLMPNIMIEHCELHRAGPADDISAVIGAIAPDVICFDFDYPDAADLNLLQETKLRHASLPILMFSEQSSAELAIWALRARVWDYFIKPVCAGEVMRRLCILSKALSDQRGESRRSVYLPQRMQFIAPTAMSCVEGTRVAVEYLEAHYDEKVTLECVAQLCGMGPYEFSRAFKREQGQTFRDYLIAMRINAAAALLSESCLSVLDIAFRIGFNDPSHFARTFRRQTGVTPTRYRIKHQAGHARVPSDGAGVTLPGVRVLADKVDALTAIGM